MSSSFVQTVVTQTMNLDLSKATAGSRNVAGLCSDIFLIVIRMRESEDLGDPESLRKLIVHYLGLFERNAKAIRAEPDTIADARYALVALIDETVLSIPGVCRDFWITNPLQLELFGDNRAGEEFFSRLDRLSKATEKKSDVLEVFYLCLSLGFEGKYKLFGHDEYRTLVDNLGRILRRSRARGSNVFSPHGRRGDTQPGRRIRGGVPFPLWLPAAACAGLCAAAWAILFVVNATEFRAILKTLTP